MLNLFKSSRELIASLNFFPITPSIAAITVFTQSVLNDRTHEVLEVLIVPHLSKQVIDVSRR